MYSNKNTYYPKNFISNSGFTLIEAVVYIALLGIIIGSFIQVGYQIIEGSNKMNEKVIILEETNFLLKKIEYYITSMTEVSLPEKNESGGMLKGETSFGEIILFFNPIDEKIVLKKDHLEMPINNNFVSIQNLIFERLVQGGKESIRMNITIDKEEYEIFIPIL